MGWIFGMRIVVGWYSAEVAVLLVLCLLRTSQVTAQEPLRIVTSASQQGGADLPEHRFLKSENDLAIAAALHQMIAIRQPVTLESFAEAIQNEFGIGVFIDRVALETADIQVDGIEFAASRLPMTLANVLTVGLRDYDLTWGVLYAQLVVTSKDECEANRLTCVMPFERSLLSQPDSSHTGDGESSCFDQLINTIVASLEQDAWEDNGGPCTVSPIFVGGRPALVVSAPYQLQVGVCQLLDQLESLNHPFTGVRVAGVRVTGPRVVHSRPSRNKAAVHQPSPALRIRLSKSPAALVHD